MLLLDNIIYNKMKYLITLLLFFFNLNLLYSLDNKSDLTNDSYPVINKIEFVGLKYARKRVLNDLPIKENEIWDDTAKNRLNNFIKKLEDENIIEKKETKYEENIERNNKLFLKIYIKEQLPFFMFIFPFYSSSAGLKIKFKYYHFNIYGYKAPFEGQIEYLEKDQMNFQLKSNEPIEIINKRLNFSFEILTYTTTFNYLSYYYNSSDTGNKEWKNGFENIYFKFDGIIPEIDLRLSPGFGFGYGNIISTDPTGDLTKYKDQDYVTVLNPKLEIYYFIKQISATIFTNFGIAYKNLYSKRYDLINYNKNEFSLTLYGNNPKESKDALTNPIRLFRFEIPIPYIYTNFYTNFDFAYKKTWLEDNKGSAVDNILIKEFDYNTFENNIIKKINNEQKKVFFNNCYFKDIEKKKYILKDVSEQDKIKIWNILIDILFVSNNGISFIPNFGFNISIPDTGLTITPEIIFSYIIRYEPDNEGKIVIYNNDLNIIPSLNIRYNIPFINGISYFTFEFKYNRFWITDIDENKDNISLIHNFSIPKIKLSFEKDAPLEEYYLKGVKATDSMREKGGHKVKINLNFDCEPLNIKKLKALFEVQYQLYLPVYKDHRYKMRLLLFSSYNKSTENSFDGNLVGDWIRGKGYPNFGGWLGVVSNFEYWLPLFKLNTSKILGKKLNNDFIWLFFWVFYIDAGLSLLDKTTDYTYNKNLLYILPALTIGTAFRVYPKFMPLIVNIEVNYNIYNYIKSKSNPLAYFYFEFSISRPSDSFFGR